MKILFVSSEIAGIAKTGGLADVSRGLPLSLKKEGHDVRAVMPFYTQWFKGKTEPAVSGINFMMNGIPMGFAADRTDITGFPVYLIRHETFFGRAHLYNENMQEYPDNASRFGFLCRAVLELLPRIDFQPDIIHCNDWQTALIPFYLKKKTGQPDTKSFYANTKSVLTVHNGEFQGKYAKDLIYFLEAAEAFHMEAFEEFGYLNILKGGLFFADYVTAVSPGYAQELLSPAGGHGLDSSYRRRGSSFSGILNGCDYSEWNPETDPHISKNYSASDMSGKADCKHDLTRYFNLCVPDDMPLIGFVGRLTAQKGLDYMIPVLERMKHLPVSFVVLGSGDMKYAHRLQRLRDANPEKMGWYMGYNEVMAHKIEAGADMFLMPSLFEPCGLNQIYSMKYGTLPIVRAVGGLKDTVTNFNQDSVENSTGFVFEIPTAESLENTVKWATDIYTHKRDLFDRTVKQAMAKDFSWDKSCQEYVNIYQQLCGPRPAKA